MKTTSTCTISFCPSLAPSWHAWFGILRAGALTQTARAPILGDSSQRPEERAATKVPEQRPQKPSPAAGKKGDRGLLDKMRARLSGGQFRMINEALYTSSASDAWAHFKDNPELFEEYHSGYRYQTESWPINPLDACITTVSALDADAVVADFGCGEAELARRVPQRQVHSFDLIADPARGITAACTTDVPLEDESVDAAVFCLSLMGTDYHASLLEARRVLRPGGTLVVAEVLSRFGGRVGAGEGDGAGKVRSLTCARVARLSLARSPPTPPPPPPPIPSSFYERAHAPCRRGGDDKCCRRAV